MAQRSIYDDYGASPLFKACEHGYDSIAKKNLSKGADVNLCLKNGASPLHIASKTNLIASYNCYVLCKGADIIAST